MPEKTDFMCICNEESRAEAEACYERVLKDLKSTPEDLLNDIVYSLQWGLGGKAYGENDWVGAIEGIGCDMWAGVSVSLQKYNTEIEKYGDAVHIWVQCDKVEHGIARAWELAKEIVEEDERLHNINTKKEEKA